jgi:16S rRNA processing protein RimM
MNQSQTKDALKDSPLICVAAISGAFGVKGEVKLKPFTESPENCVSYGPLLDEVGAIVLTPLSHRVMKDFIAVTASEITSREMAEALKSTKLYVPRASLPEPDSDDFYYSDLVGLDVKSTDGKRIGTVTAVHMFGAGDMLEITPHPDKKTKKRAASFFHPFTKAATPKIDIKAGRLVIVPQEAE